MTWTYAYALRAGAAHERCDDAVACDAMGGTLIAAVADGAGSASHSGQGANLACNAFCEMAVGLARGSTDPQCLLAEIRSRIPNGQLESHHCTLIGVVANPQGVYVLQVGDGAVVVRMGEEYTLALWPDEGECLNETVFVTMDAAEARMKTVRIEGQVKEVALFTDGLQHLILDRKAKKPHGPFFASVFERLAEAPGHDKRASWWLGRMLASDPVVKRTDDDTSIVVARTTSW